MNATFSRARAGQPRVVCEPSVFEKLLPPLAFPRSSLRARVSTTASSPRGAEAASLARAHDERDRGRHASNPCVHLHDHAIRRLLPQRFERLDNQQIQDFWLCSFVTRKARLPNTLPARCKSVSRDSNLLVP